MPPLRGIMHAAMVLDDGLIQHLDADRLARVMGLKRSEHGICISLRKHCRSTSS